MAEHRVGLVQLVGARSQLARRRRRVAWPSSSMSASSCGRNSCSGGSSRRMVTGRPAMISEDARRSPRAASAGAWRARLRAAFASSARIISRTATMRSASKNMCSVRQRPMPSAPNLRAVRGVGRRVGVGAHLQRAHLVGPAHQRRRSRRTSSGCDRRHVAEHDLAGRAVERDDRRPPSRTVPRTVMRLRLVVDAAASPAPATQGLPMPRATTAAWLVMPPRAVRMPSAACMPWMSSGEVSTRTRITFSPCAAPASRPRRR